MRQNRYVFVANSSWYINNFRINTVDKFNGIGVVICLAPKDVALKNLIKRIPININTHSTNLLTEASTIVSIFTALLKTKGDIVFSFNPKTNIYSMICCYLLKIPIVVNISGVGSASQLSGITGFFYNKFNCFFVKRSSYVFFQNEIDYKAYLELGLVNTERSEVLPGSGVDLSKFKPSLIKCKRASFLLAARLIKQKGVLEFLTASKILAAEYKTIDVKLAGVTDSSSRAIKQDTIDGFSSYDWFTYLGMRNDIDVVLSEIDCVVLPSYYPEGTPRSLLEAAAAGKVIITTDTPGCRDVVIEGVNGFLVPPRDTEALKEAMAKVINLSDEKLAEMQANSRKLAEEKFDEQYVIQRYLDVAEEILAKKSK